MQSPRAAVQEPHPQMRLQRSDMIAGHLRRNAEMPRGSGEAAGIHGALEHRHAGQSVHARALRSPTSERSKYSAGSLLMSATPPPLRCIGTDRKKEGDMGIGGAAGYGLALLAIRRLELLGALITRSLERSGHRLIDGGALYGANLCAPPDALGQHSTETEEKEIASRQ